MSDHDMFAELVVGRALDALEPGDDALLTAHLRGCDTCTELLAGMRQTAAALAYDTDPAEPPPELVERIRAALPVPDLRAAVPDQERRRGTPTWHRPRSWLRIPARTATRVAAGVAAAAVLFSGGYAWHAYEHRGTAAKTLASEQVVLEHLGASASYSVSLVSGGAATGTAVVDGRHVDLVASGLGRNDTHDSIYVLWAAARGTTTMTAIAGFDVTSDGLSVVHATLPPGVVGPTTFGVTHEAGRTLPATPGQAVLGVRNG